MRLAFAVLGLVACRGEPETAGLGDTAPRVDTEPAGCEPRAETCNGLDDDCDGAIDLPVPPDAPSWYADADGDGHGTDAVGVVACAAPDGHAAPSDDCDDTRPGVFPGAPDPDPTCGDELGDCDAVAPCRYAGVYDLVSADAVVRGDGEDVVGGNVAGVGDVTGDGLPDVVTGVWLLSWPGEGEHRLADVVQFGVEGGVERLATIPGAAGDFDADGHRDLLYAWNSTDVSEYDQLFVLPGPFPRTMSRDDGWRLDDAKIDARAPAAGVGDLDADGFDDVLSVCSEPLDWLLRACVFRGRSTAGPDHGDVRLYGAARDSAAVTSVGALGDTDGDGLPDFAIGAKSLSAGAWGGGGVYVYTHLPSGDGLLSDADALLTGENDYELAGFDLDGAGDVNGDGYADLIVGNVTSRYIPDETVEQLVAASLVLGPIGAGSLGGAEARFVVPNGWEGYQGVRVRGAGDLDAVAGDEILLGLPGWGGWDWAGSVFVHAHQQGVVAADDAVVEFRAEQDFHYIGGSFDGMGDADGDGRPDLAFGAFVEPGSLFFVTGHGW